LAFTYFIKIFPRKIDKIVITEIPIIVPKKTKGGLYCVAKVAAAI
jgi:hypothetical protein